MVLRLGAVVETDGGVPPPHTNQGSSCYQGPGRDVEPWAGDPRGRAGGGNYYKERTLRHHRPGRLRARIRTGEAKIQFSTGVELKRKVLLEDLLLESLKKICHQRCFFHGRGRKDEGEEENGDSPFCCQRQDGSHGTPAEGRKAVPPGPVR